MKKGLIATFMVALMLVTILSSVVSVNGQPINTINEENLKADTPIQSSYKVELPDLIIKKIILVIDSPNPYVYNLFCRVKNIGEGTSIGYIEIDVKIIESLLIGIIPIKMEHNFNDGKNYTLEPQETADIYFASSDDLFLYLLNANQHYTAWVNQERIIEESNYTNNIYTEGYVHPGSKQQNRGMVKSLIEIFPLLNLLLQRLRI